jgi:two-component system, OmpR family, osmolarity sensor histidine kinase EnvZ
VSKPTATLQFRLVLLLALSIVGVALSTFFLIRSFSAQNSADEIARLAFLALRDSPDLASSDDVSIQIQRPEPAARLPQLLSKVRSELVAQASESGREVIISRSGERLRDAEFTVWLGRDQRWLGIRLHTEREAFLPRALLWMGGLALVIFIAARSLARYINQPLQELAEQARALLSGQGLRSSHTNAPLEVQTLSLALQDAAAAEKKMAHERELMWLGISHDLRTPLARLRMALELSEVADGERNAMIADLAQMESVIAHVLSQARGKSERSSTDDLLICLQSNLKRRNVEWQLQSELSALPLALPWTSFNRVLGNLLDNAEQHGHAPFRVELTRLEQVVQIDVCNAGELDRNAAEHLMLSGSEQSNYGLALAMRMARSFGADLDFVQQAPGEVRVRLSFASV